MTILKMSSMEPMTEYAPFWNYSFFLKKWDRDMSILDTIRSWLLENEKKIINKFSYDYDGYTGLGKSSVTGRFSQYNLFHLTSELPELKELLDFIKDSYVEFVSIEDNPIRETEVVSWYNVLRKGQQVQEHNHGSGNDVYLSGTFVLDDYPTFTNFKCPFDRDVILPIPNNKGLLTFFPSFVYHYSDEYKGDSERLTIAFDIRIPGIQESKDRKAIPFITLENTQ